MKVAVCVLYGTPAAGASADASQLVATFSAAGIELIPAEADRAELPKLVVCGAIDAELIALLQRSSRRGLDRVLVLYVGPPEGDVRASAWRLLEAGASDVVSWRNDCAAEIAARLSRWHEVDLLLRAPAVENNLIGRSRVWLTLLREVVEVARFSDAAVLISGESGTGKELIARLIHTLDGRPDKKDLVVVDCTTLTRDLAGSELFGHERGAYTGAGNAREGAVALADSGTLFLDEVGELPLPLQAQLLRLSQERTYKRVGGNGWLSSRFRLVSATNRDLAAEVQQGSFRADLFYRLTTWVCRAPSLRERPEDVMPLVEHFVRTFLPHGHVDIDETVQHYLLQRDYPGNVRELRQVVQRMCARYVGHGPLTVGHVAGHERPALPFDADWRSGPFESGVRRALSLGTALREIGRAAEGLAVEIAVGEEQGNLQRAARRLGVTDRALQLRRSEQRR
jgi:transcriptional regulator with GAF, ATPase, and Fis domain